MHPTVKFRKAHPIDELKCPISPTLCRPVAQVKELLHEALGYLQRSQLKPLADLDAERHLNGSDEEHGGWSDGDDDENEDGGVSSGGAGVGATRGGGEVVVVRSAWAHHRLYKERMDLTTYQPQYAMYGLPRARIEWDAAYSHQALLRVQLLWLEMQCGGLAGGSGNSSSSSPSNDGGGFGGGDGGAGGAAAGMKVLQQRFLQQLSQSGRSEAIESTLDDLVAAWEGHRAQEAATTAAAGRVEAAGLKLLEASQQAVSSGEGEVIFVLQMAILGQGLERLVGCRKELVEAVGQLKQALAELGLSVSGGGCAGSSGGAGSSSGGAGISVGAGSSGSLAGSSSGASGSGVGGSSSGSGGGGDPTGGLSHRLERLLLHSSGAAVLAGRVEAVRAALSKCEAAWDLQELIRSQGSAGLRQLWKFRAHYIRNTVDACLQAASERDMQASSG